MPLLGKEDLDVLPLLRTKLFKLLMTFVTLSDYDLIDENCYENLLYQTLLVAYKKPVKNDFDK